ncbi:MAG: cytochrome c3 family protein [Myxococcales bacterium]|nr:cytochrome c3 family protein [Myxococcales bacterium]MDH3484366.1 cytochrome c3 family protein [Myxococcales bacterium]
MKGFVTALLLACVALTSRVKADDLSGGECLECHLEIEDPITELWKDDVHAHAGIGCDGCHGGDSTKDDSELAKRSGSGYRGQFTPRQIVLSCGGCHADIEYMKARKPLLSVDQLEKYWTSQHGKLLAKGETRVAQCVSCHGAHGVREVNDPKSPVYAANVPATCAHCHADAEYMSEFDIATNQYDEYAQSVHGKALLEKNDVRGAPACNDCHGNHGAAPPSIDAITNICGTCHSYNAELFLGSPLAPGFKEKSLADCVACHGKHLITHASDDWLEDEPGGACRKCHETGDEGSDLALYYADTLGSIRQSFDEIDELLARAEVKGMDVTEGEDYEQAARQGLLQARTLIHAFSKPVMEEKVTDIAQNQAAALEVGYAQLKAFDDRRRGLAISTLLLLLLTIGVAIKIRTLPPLE